MRGFLQKKGNGLGNFIMLTPALQLLYKKNGCKVDVAFQTSAIESLFRECPFINVVAAHRGLRPITIPKRLKDESDIQAYCRIYANKIGKINSLPPTYVDINITKKLEPPHNRVAVFHGCLGTLFKANKNLGEKVRQHIIDAVCECGLHPVVLGNQSDYDNYWRKNNLEKCENYLGKISLKESISILSQCKFFISNDTGLYHVAGALKKPGLVLWTKTDPTKNGTTCKKIQHVFSKNIDVVYMKREIDTYLENQ